MSTPARPGVLSATAGLTRAAVYAPDWRKAFAAALGREVEERRFFLWLPVAAMGGVALNLAADREPGSLASRRADRPVRGARLGLPRSALRARALARSCRSVRRVPRHVAAH